MPLWTWRTSATGLVEVDQTGDGNFEAITLPGPDAQTAKTETWAPLASACANRYDVPLPWVLGVIYAESGGNPRARNECCGGLMQLSLATWHITEAQSFDPVFNVDLGAKILGKSRAAGRDLPTSAAVYNAGSVRKSAKSVWGMVENMPATPWTGYIEKVVRASNWWTMRGVPGVSDGPTPSSSPPPGTAPAQPTPVGARASGIVVASVVGAAALGAFFVTRWMLDGAPLALGRGTVHL